MSQKACHGSGGVGGSGGDARAMSLVLGTNSPLTCLGTVSPDAAALTAAAANHKSRRRGPTFPCRSFYKSADGGASPMLSQTGPAFQVLHVDRFCRYTAVETRSILMKISHVFVGRERRPS